jgi:hypothetical protein
MPPSNELQCPIVRRMLTSYRKAVNMASSMKTTVDLPEMLLREAKAMAARQGRTLRDFVAEAMNEKLHPAHSAHEKPWMKHFGALSKLRKETRRINNVVEKEFETVNPEEWQ